MAGTGDELSAATGSLRRLTGLGALVTLTRDCRHPSGRASPRAAPPRSGLVLPEKAPPGEWQRHRSPEFLVTSPLRGCVNRGVQGGGMSSRLHPRHLGI